MTLKHKGSGILYISRQEGQGLIVGDTSIIVVSARPYHEASLRIKYADGKEEDLRILEGRERMPGDGRFTLRVERVRDNGVRLGVRAARDVPIDRIENVNGVGA